MGKDSLSIEDEDDDDDNWSCALKEAVVLCIGDDEND
jgi:hypothetical protein